MEERVEMEGKEELAGTGTGTGIEIETEIVGREGKAKEGDLLLLV
jgi:hypothetical protein